MNYSFKIKKSISRRNPVNNNKPEVFKITDKYLRKSLPVDVKNAFLELANALINPTNLKTCMVLSSIHGEGTTFVALNLARTLSCMGKFSVLYMDMNLSSSPFNNGNPKRSPHPADEFQEGKDDRELKKRIRKTDVDNLYFFSLGETAQELSMVLNSSKIKKILDTVNEKFDFIIMDSAPVNPEPDSLAVVPYADGVVLVVLASKTRREVVQKAKETLESKQANILGVVMNRRKHFIPRFIYKHL
jgi:capsular exopolysaccharide synthesis family protein